MAEGNDHSAIVPLNATAQKEGLNLTGLIIIDIIVTILALYIVGKIANAIF